MKKENAMTPERWGNYSRAAAEITDAVMEAIPFRNNGGKEERTALRDVCALLAEIATATFDEWETVQERWWRLMEIAALRTGHEIKFEFDAPSDAETAGEEDAPDEF